jgi:hypothetical protein
MNNSTPEPLMTAKSRFMLSETRKSNHREMIASEIFKASSESAMLHYLNVIAGTVRDANSAVAAGFKLAGAFEVMYGLKTLAETPPVFTGDKQPGNLDHSV